MTRWVALLTAIVLPAMATAEGGFFGNVRHAPDIFDPRGAEGVAIEFRLRRPARVSVFIHDAREYHIRTLDSGEILPAGDHTLRWDGRELKGRVVPPEAYTYTLKGVAEDGTQGGWDVTDSTGGERGFPKIVSWEPKAGEVSYRLKEPSRIRLRIGVANNGPLLRTLLDWVPRTAGAHSESWDGLDATGTRRVGEHPSLALQVESFALSRNTVIVGPPSQQVRLIQGPESELGPKRMARTPAQVGMLDYAKWPVEERRDFTVGLTLPSDLEVTNQGLPIVDREVAVSFELEDVDLRRMVNQQSEVVYYLDDRLIFESETAFLPMTWRWDPEGVPPGSHYLTLNLRGYEGYFGIGTIQVYVP